ncbi:MULTISPECIES: metallophosphoesterase family protein [Bacillota]|jgi:uncharacterized protein|uniref:Phosphoesterase n=2 Tax=Amedibacillus TaxID=2749846 RepID=A0A7G9GKI3_9FIRM|nr:MULTISPECIES: YfcE family phosphodiesterase [Bacillota]QNM11315.1 metallophosphoesterase family protein [[Eubacterium] hominis]MCH4284681.1 metallophosphatase family protein [Amedibacillus hominis]RGB49640.1 metallophosphoesterase [Absiella sp. AM22-9]RGB60292.1 metallophosphoesterase [Absiella sp. AM10-20]RGB68160.1 metallophosphoesterase [Absiella sp. AM09-45]
MKILLISDTHGELENTRKLIHKHKDVDLKIDLGDIGFALKELDGFVVVKGNHDKALKLPIERIVEVENHRILCVHGDIFEADVMEEVFSLMIDEKEDIMQVCMDVLYHHIADYAKKKQCDIVFFGHTHIRVWEIYDGITIVNPGSLLFGMDGNDKSYAIVNVTKEDVQVEFYDMKGKNIK